MKTTLFVLLLSTTAWASKPVQPNFFAVDTGTAQIQPDLAVAKKHFENRIQQKEADRRPKPKEQMSAAERAATNSMNIGM